jgi:uncharacterized protein YbcV (DUF1398 family)
MFTLEQIRAAHSKVKTGADFPAYIQDMKRLGVQSYAHFVSDGHIIYFGVSDFRLSSPPKWEPVSIPQKGRPEKLKHEIQIHQAGKTDYPAFCRQSAEAGVNKWVVDMQKMTCIYYDQMGNEMVSEPIPAANEYAH